MRDIYSISVFNSRLQQTVDAIDAGYSNGFPRLIDGAGNVVSSFQLTRPSAAIVGCWMRSRNHVLNPSLSGRDPGRVKTLCLR